MAENEMLTDVPLTQIRDFLHHPYLVKDDESMDELGADTFWEAYIPDDLDFSPYNDRMINSLCHAWSCTPSYFIRKYGL